MYVRSSSGGEWRVIEVVFAERNMLADFFSLFFSRACYLSAYYIQTYLPPTAYSTYLPR